MSKPQRTTPTTPTGAACDWLVVIAASTGGIQAIRTILSRLAPNPRTAVVLVQHRSPGHNHFLSDLLGHGSAWPVGVATDGEAIEAGRVYLARADRHLAVTPDHRFQYWDGTRILSVRSSANMLFESAANAFGGQVVAVVLTGTGRDATEGVQHVKAQGGTVIAQDEESSQRWEMPQSAIESGAVDYVLALEDIAPVIEQIVRGAPAARLSAAPQ